MTLAWQNVQKTKIKKDPLDLSLTLCSKWASKASVNQRELDETERSTTLAS